MIIFWLGAESHDRPLTKVEWSKIKASYEYIADHIKIDFGLLEELQAVDAMTREHIQCIESIRIPFEKIEELLAIIRRRSFNQYQQFLRCLRKTKQDDIVDILEADGGKHLVVCLTHLFLVIFF